MFTHRLLACFALILSACTGSTGGNGNGDTVGGPDTNDPGSGYEGTASVTVKATKLGSEANNLPVVLTCGDMVYTGQTGVPFQNVVAPETCSAEVGDPELTPVIGFPAYQDELGDYWAAPVLTNVATQVGTQTDAVAELFKLFEPGGYDFTVDVYFYDATAGDLKGEFFKSYDFEDNVSVSHEGIVEATTYEDLEVMGDDGDYLSIVDDEFVLTEVDVQHDMYVSHSLIGEADLEVTVVWPNGYVSELSGGLR